MIFIKRTFEIRHSGEIRDVGLDAGLVKDSDHPIIYVEDYVGFKVNDQLPDEAIENGISDTLARQLAVENAVFAYKQDSDHPDFDDKREELVAKYDETHPDLTDQR